jgi:hypothetical protein
MKQKMMYHCNINSAHIHQINRVKGQYAFQVKTRNYHRSSICTLATPLLTKVQYKTTNINFHFCGTDSNFTK